MQKTPVIDIFAGAGGLSEGFGGYSTPELSFDIRLSIEKEAYACDTLRMRSLFRKSKDSRVPELYYDAIKGDRYALERIRMTTVWNAAADHVRNWTLGRIDPRIVHATIREKIGGRRDWVLLGGPPCQTYSIIGRLRRTGLGSQFSDEKLREEHRRQLEEVFATDHRHTLYRQYLEIVAIHQPAIFVMENVKGILSARLPIGRGRRGELLYEPVIERIMADLRDPRRALQRDKSISPQRGFAAGGMKYRLMSFVNPAGPSGECENPAEFVIECEKYSIPQTRHRVIILGVREDLDTTELEILRERKNQLPAKTLLKGLPRIRSSLSAASETRREYGRDSQESWQCAMKDALPKSAYSRLDNKTKRKIVQILDRKSTALSSGGPFVEGPTDPKDAPPVLRKFIRDIRLGGAIQHESRSHMASDLGRYLYSAALASTTGLSPRIEEWPQELLPAHRNVRVTRKRSKTVVDGFRDRFRVQVWDKPASTIMSHNSKDGHYIIHPDPAQCRSLTVRETARLQTFPDNYYFSGSRTEQYLQVGNAVPPFLALQLARVVAKLLEVNGAALTSERMKTFNRSGRAPLAIKYAASMR